MSMYPNEDRDLAESIKRLPACDRCGLRFELGFLQGFLAMANIYSLCRFLVLFLYFISFFFPSSQLVIKAFVSFLNLLLAVRHGIERRVH